MSRMLTVIPAPVSAEPRPGADFDLTAATAIVAVDEAGPVAGYLAEILRAATGYAVPVVPDPTPGSIELSVGGGEDGYRLDVDPQGVKLSAATAGDLFAGVQTLRQLLPATGTQWTVAGGRIVDRPRYAYRGVMLDVSRHFFTVAEVRRFIDLVAQYKVNHLHLHLTDDHGWRIEIRRWPRLTEHGGTTAMGGGPGGFYTQDQYREIVAYAASRYITVVPEIDVPGHTTAALASYAELTRDGVALPLYTGTSKSKGFSSLCTDREITYRFVDEVFGELAALTPGPYLHIGTDETHATPEEEYLRFVERVVPMVAAHGKTVVGWQEMLRAAPPASAGAQYWGRGTDDRLIVEAAARGNPVIMSPNKHAYLDMKYTPETPIGFDWAGHTDVEKSYGWDPETLIDGLPKEAVIGVEGPLWTETVERFDQVEYMTFPRLPALAELGWSPRATHDWPDFRRRLAAHGPRLAAQGVNFYRSAQVPWEG
ncbi:beta-N-acetylhexosaminidase [Virgisporangium aurantiacum]